MRGYPSLTSLSLVGLALLAALALSASAQVAPNARGQAAPAPSESRTTEPAPSARGQNPHGSEAETEKDDRGKPGAGGCPLLNKKLELIV